MIWVTIEEMMVKIPSWYRGFNGIDAPFKMTVVGIKTVIHLTTDQ